MPTTNERFKIDEKYLRSLQEARQPEASPVDESFHALYTEAIHKAQLEAIDEMRILLQADSTNEGTKLYIAKLLLVDAR